MRMVQRIKKGTVHTMPLDMRRILMSSEELLQKWNDLTPLARNEWICWTTSVKKLETRKKHIERLFVEIRKGKRRPCCWAGCPHR